LITISIVESLLNSVTFVLEKDSIQTIKILKDNVQTKGAKYILTHPSISMNCSVRNPLATIPSRFDEYDNPD